MLPPALVSTLTQSEAVTLLLALAGSWIVVYASLHHWGADVSCNYFFRVDVFDGTVVDCINGQVIMCKCFLGVAFSTGSGYSCQIGLDAMESYLI